MKSNAIIFSTFCIILAIFLLNNSLVAQEEPEVKTIQGTVVATEWDEDDNVSGVAISVVVEPEDETEEAYVEEYIVADNAKGHELLNLVGEEVEATGTLETDEDGYITITVMSYKIME